MWRWLFFFRMKKFLKSDFFLDFFLWIRYTVDHGISDCVSCLTAGHVSCSWTLPVVCLSTGLYPWFGCWPWCFWLCLVDHGVSDCASLAMVFLIVPLHLAAMADKVLWIHELFHASLRSCCILDIKCLWASACLGDMFLHLAVSGWLCFFIWLLFLVGRWIRELLLDFTRGLAVGHGASDCASSSGCYCYKVLGIAALSTWCF